ncbi:MAG: PhoH family protein [Acidimicrobiia bacterium]|nr:PhoH family protein [Acidimicrobiia bacterium]MCY4456832.1 PhoH family protein [Acidimicrobiaceae bacterium]
MTEHAITLQIPDNRLMGALLGEYDQHLRKIEEAFPAAQVTVRGNEVHLSGPDAEAARTTFEELVLLAESGQRLDHRTLDTTIDMVRADERPSSILTHEILRAERGRVIRPKSSGQKRYVEAIENNVVTFGIGPAGTGKSWLAVATAVAALQAGLVERIILTRPAVEAGERLGFLPGDLMAKVDPYLRPLYDALGDMAGTDGVERLMSNRTVEVAPLAFMRGRTLNSSFIILDEAQNTTSEQMKMFLTRIGHGSKAVVTGDITQVDVATGRSGLSGLEPILGGIEGVCFVWLTKRDVVRHRIVQEIVDAYETAADNAQLAEDSL